MPAKEIKFSEAEEMMRQFVAEVAVEGVAGIQDSGIVFNYDIAEMQTSDELPNLSREYLFLFLNGC